LTFALYRPDGSPLPCQYRLKDIKAAIPTLREEQDLIQQTYDGTTGEAGHSF
jgi:hypothetical protein